MRSVRVVVIGGGIGGLSATLALRAAGADVRVYEQAADFGEVGAGVALNPGSAVLTFDNGVSVEASAHAMLPHMGQGANQSIEDGMGLATLMHGVDAAHVTDGLIRYQALRHDHTARVQRGSRTNGKRMDSGQAITIGQAGVQDYDVEAEARAMR
jgi:2-polyprenyl-6-methoxyphenol hydroxylase-like FAD-dependent oxidoreductase